MTSKTQHTVSRTKGILTVGRTQKQKAVVITLNIEPAHKDNQQIAFRGMVKFSKRTRDHIKQVIVPLVDHILEELKVSRPGLVISATNLAVASISNVGIDVSGFSLDTGVFLGLLSQCLGVALADDIVTTGHIASERGDITAVKGIPAKLDAAILNPSIHRFIYPDLDRDRSLKVLSPNQRGLVSKAVMAARDSIEITSVRGIGDLVKAVFTDEAIVQASLKRGFFGYAKLKDTRKDPVSDTVCLLTHANEMRLWQALHGHLLYDRCERARALLQAYCEYFLNRQIYPTAIGKRLYQFVCALPPSIRRVSEAFPLIDTGLCIKVIQYATPSDHADVLRLFDAAHGQNIVHDKDANVASLDNIIETPDLGCLVFDRIAEKMNPRTLAHNFGISIDSARGSFVLGSSTVRSWDQFMEILQAFFVHLHRHVHSQTGVFIDVDRVRTEVSNLLEAAFKNKGGAKAAFARARDGTEGGLRSVLDVLTEHFKSEQQLKHVQCIFKDAVDGLEWDDRVKFIGGALERLRPLLPPEIRDEPPERFARGFEMLVQAYVQSLDQMDRALHAL